MIYLKFKWAFSSVFSEIDAWIQTTELKIETFPLLKLYDIYGMGWNAEQYCFDVP